MAEDTNELLARAYALSGPDEAVRVYDHWAETYNADTVDAMGYVAPRRAASRLASLISAPATVLDAGCGTGLAGAELYRLAEADLLAGLTIDGVDISPGMLAQARELGVYRDLSTADLTGPLAIADSSYDAVLCVGTLTSGHVGPDALDEMVRVTRPGGHVVVTVQATVWESGGYRARLDQLAGNAAVNLIEAEEGPYHEKEGINGYLCVLELR